MAQSEEPEEEQGQEAEELGSMGGPMQVQQYLAGIEYPADKQTIMDTAEQQGAGDMVMDMLNRLPDREYESPTQITDEISSLM